jgi:hypothetical protein
VAMNIMFACLPIWRTGTMVICKCGGHISIELKCNHENIECCNCCDIDDRSSKCSHSICSCTGIPISNDFGDHAVSFNNAQDSYKGMFCIDYRISQFIGSYQPVGFHKLDYYSGTDKKVIDILRTTIMLI